MCLVCDYRKILKHVLGLMELMMTVLNGVSAMLCKENYLARLKFIYS